MSSELSLSMALLDPGTLRPRDYQDEESNFPALVDHEPYETTQEPMLLFKPPTIKRTQPRERKKSQGLVSDLFKKKQKPKAKEGTLYRSRSFDTLHRRLRGWDVTNEKDEVDGGDEATKKPKPETFVYQPPRRRAKKSLGDTKKEKEPVVDTVSAEPAVSGSDQSPPARPKRDSELMEDNAMMYEVPISILNKNSNSEATNKTEVNAETNPGSNAEEMDSSSVSKEEPTSIYNPLSDSKGSLSPKAPPKPVRQKRKGAEHQKERRRSFTEQDLMPPSKSEELSPVLRMNSSVGMLRVRVLGISIPQKHNIRKSGGSSDSEDEEDAVTIPAVTEINPTDGVFCTLSINGKPSRHESSLQPLKPRAQTAVFDHTESEAVFYSTQKQQLFVTCRKLPLKAHQDEHCSTSLSQNPSAECFGVGIHTLAQQKLVKVSEKDGMITDWSAVTADSKECGIQLEPQGSILLGMSYILLHPQSKVTCNGTVTIKGLSGVDCFRNGEPCWTCCTVDIDNENFGTTSSVLSMDDFLSKGFVNDPIEFSATDSCFCRVQVWGFGNDETEYWFGEAYIPLAAVFPYSKLIVHQEEEDKPLQLLEKFEREITMPVEPVGLITIIFSMYPPPEQNELKQISNETIQILEASGIFTPQAIAHFRSQSSADQQDEENMTDEDDEIKLKPSKIATIPEEVSLGASSSGQSLLTKPRLLSTKKKPGEVYRSGEYDHLSPPQTSLSSTNPILRSITNSLKDKKQTLRLLGNLKLQVPKNYQEKAFRQLPDNFDPYREIEILKVDLRDVKAQLAETQFHREKAELKVKMLEKEVEAWKEKYKMKKKGRKYY